MSDRQMTRTLSFQRADAALARYIPPDLRGYLRAGFIAGMRSLAACPNRLLAAIALAMALAGYLVNAVRASAKSSPPAPVLPDPVVTHGPDMSMYLEVAQMLLERTPASRVSTKQMAYIMTCTVVCTLVSLAAVVVTAACVLSRVEGEKRLDRMCQKIEGVGRQVDGVGSLTSSLVIKTDACHRFLRDFAGRAQPEPEPDASDLLNRLEWLVRANAQSLDRAVVALNAVQLPRTASDTVGSAWSPPVSAQTPGSSSSPKASTTAPFHPYIARTVSPGRLSPHAVNTLRQAVSDGCRSNKKQVRVPTRGLVPLSRLQHDLVLAELVQKQQALLYDEFLTSTHSEGAPVAVPSKGVPRASSSA